MYICILSGNQRVNIDLGTSYKLLTFEFTLYIRSDTDPASTIYMYGSNNTTSYNDTSVSTRTTDSNLILLGSLPNLNTSMWGGAFQYIYSSDTTNLYRYVLFYYRSVDSCR